MTQQSNDLYIIIYIRLEQYGKIDNIHIIRRNTLLNVTVKLPQ